jgi:nucleotide-binding universal stress UspA family protein
MSTATLAPFPALDDVAEEAIVVPGTRTPTGRGPVVAAVDDDGNVDAVLRHANATAARLGVPLRVAYVWSDCRPPECPHHRRCHRDLGEATRLLAELVDERLTESEAEQVERDVVHHPDPPEALVALSATASLLVVGAASHRPGPGDALGDTTRSLVGRTRCPVAVVPHHERSATGPAW